MKKKFLTIAMVLCIAFVLIFSVACVNGGGNDKDEDLPSGSNSSGEITSGGVSSGNEEIKVTSIVIENKTITLESGGEYTLNYTVTPAGGKVKITLPDGNLLDNTIISDTDGVAKIKANTSGTGKLRISAADNADVYDECDVTVAPPQGYSQYERALMGIKFVYPSTWKSVNGTGALVCYQDTEDESSNMNLMYQTKTTAYLNATAQDFKQALTSQLKSAGYSSVEFSNVTVEKYDNNTALHVVMEYEVKYYGISIEFYQEQFIRNSSSRTYYLTLTFLKDNYNAEVSNTIIREYVTW